MLTPDETYDLAEAMADRAERDAEAVRDYAEPAAYWEGWTQALRTLGSYVKTDVRATCLPVGSCECHREQVVRL